MRAFTRTVAAVAVFVLLSCGGSGGTDGSSASSGSAPTAPSIPTLTADLIAPDLARTVAATTLAAFRDIMVQICPGCTFHFGKHALAPTPGTPTIRTAAYSTTRNCPAGGSAQINNAPGDLQWFLTWHLTGWTEVLNNCQWSAGGQNYGASGTLLLDGTYWGLFDQPDPPAPYSQPVKAQVSGSLDVTNASYQPLRGARVDGTVYGDSTFTGTIGGVPTTVGSAPAPTPTPTPTPTPSPTPSPSPSGSCTFSSGCILSVLYNGSLSGATDFDMYFVQGSTTCTYPKTGSGSTSSLCYGPGCQGDPLRTSSRQFSVLPRTSGTWTVYLTRAPSTRPSGSGRSVSLATCSPSSITFP